MRYVWIAFLGLATLLLGLLGWQRLRPAAEPAAGVVESSPVSPVSMAPAAQTQTPVSPPAKRRPKVAVWAPSRPVPRADSLITFAIGQIGAGYTYAGTTPEGGFDCSGFLMYVYNRFGVSVPHSTALLINTGRPVPREHARKGDIVVFTGTSTTSTTPGHAGIVITDPGEPIRFIHSSSARKESGVKISKVEGTDYERRFMAVRRVL
ncbi:C40 family peptidase [Hymenobacter sp. BT175]|uniref:C40 family peptidase n=1 Tax=Hymenobacter translucens TaxID=2886507 RepID=UPI001D0F3BA3|nr:NlpC/P60 family protein [Hymenobacter translucens]MCC2544972.1 C40 family peptidase [Hymenobacter translucens]